MKQFRKSILIISFVAVSCAQECAAWGSYFFPGWQQQRASVHPSYQQQYANLYAPQQYSYGDDDLLATQFYEQSGNSGDTSDSEYEDAREELQVAPTVHVTEEAAEDTNSSHESSTYYRNTYEDAATTAHTETGESWWFTNLLWNTAELLKDTVSAYNPIPSIINFVGEIFIAQKVADIVCIFSEKPKGEIYNTVVQMLYGLSVEEKDVIKTELISLLRTKLSREDKSIFLDRIPSTLSSIGKEDRALAIESLKAGVKQAQDMKKEIVFLKLITLAGDISEEGRDSIKKALHAFVDDLSVNAKHEIIGSYFKIIKSLTPQGKIAISKCMPDLLPSLTEDRKLMLSEQLKRSLDTLSARNDSVDSIIEKMHTSIISLNTVGLY